MMCGNIYNDINQGRQSTWICRAVDHGRDMTNWQFWMTKIVQLGRTTHCTFWWLNLRHIEQWQQYIIDFPGVWGNDHWCDQKRNVLGSSGAFAELWNLERSLSVSLNGSGCVDISPSIMIFRDKPSNQRLTGTELAMQGLVMGGTYLSSSSMNERKYKARLLLKVKCKKCT